MASDIESCGSPGSPNGGSLAARLERLEAKLDAELSMLRECNERASSYYSELLETRCMDVEHASRQQQQLQSAVFEAKCTELEKRFVSQEKLDAMCRDVMQASIQHAELIEANCLKVFRASLEDFKGDVVQLLPKKNKALVPERGSADDDNNPLMLTHSELDNTRELEKIELSDNIAPSASVNDSMPGQDVTESLRALVEKLDQQCIQGLAPDVQQLKGLLFEKSAKPAVPDHKLLDLLLCMAAENKAAEKKVTKGPLKQVGTPSFADLSGLKQPPPLFEPGLQQVLLGEPGLQQVPLGGESLHMRPWELTGAATPGTRTPGTRTPGTRTPPFPISAPGSVRVTEVKDMGAPAGCRIRSPSRGLYPMSSPRMGVTQTRQPSNANVVVARGYNTRPKVQPPAAQAHKLG